MPEEREEAPRPEPDTLDVSRRTFLKGAGITIAAVGVGARPATLGAQTASGGAPVVGEGAVQIALTLNGQKKTIEVEPWMTLLDTVRDRVGLTGAKRVCDRGSCGACTMLVDGKAVNSCSFLAIDAAGREVVTIEGIAAEGELSPLQKAFVECDALQCGFCTPGMVVACTALLERNPKPTREEVAKGISGNICRCGTYQNIFEAVEKVAKGGTGRARF